MSDWIAVEDPSSGRVYYANMVTKETSWEVPPGFVGTTQPQVQYTGGSQTNLYTQSAVNLHQQQPASQAYQPYSASARVLTGAPQQQQPQQQPQTQALQPAASAASKWRKVHDESSDRDYWFHVDTKETTWYMPPDWQESDTSGTARRLSAQIAVMGMDKSMVNFNTNAWEDDTDDDDESESSWDDNKQGDDSESDSGDGLQAYQGTQQAAYSGPTNVIEVSDSEDSDAENAPNIFSEEDGELIATEEEVNKYWQIGQSQGEQFPLAKYAQTYFNKQKKGILKVATIGEVLAWQTGKPGLRKALRRMDNKLEEDALQCFRNITGYMGDRASGKDSAGHVEKLLRFALKSPEEFRDEIYCQLCKQTTNNPAQASLAKGWHLMAICCSTFPPSEEFACYLAAYLYKNTQFSGVIGDWARYCLLTLDRTMAVGQRREQPTAIEVAKIVNRERVPIKIYFLDKSFKTILVHTQTRAKEVAQTLGMALKLNHPESFGLFEMEFPEHGWDMTVYADRQSMDRQQKINELVNLPADKELEMNERVLDVMASWGKKRRKARQFYLVFKCKIHSKAQENSYSRNGWKQAFLSAVYHVVTGYYPVDQEQCMHLAALQLQGMHGLQSDGFYSEGVILNQVGNFLPHAIGAQMSPNEGEQQILRMHGVYKHLDKQDVYRKYVELLRQNDDTNKFMGNVFFRCVRVSRLKRQQETMQDDVMLGISENGVIFLDPVSKTIIDRYKMEEILTYGFRNNAFLFVAGTLMTQKKFHFATMLGKQMNDLLRAHIDLRVQQAELQGYNVMT